MDTTISISDDIALKLQELAATHGQSAPDYAAKLVADTLTRPSLDELLAPVRADFARTVLTDDQIMDLGRRELDALRQ